MPAAHRAASDARHVVSGEAIAEAAIVADAEREHVRADAFPHTDLKTRARDDERPEEGPGSLDYSESNAHGNALRRGRQRVH